MFPPMTPLTERVRIEFEQRRREAPDAVPVERWSLPRRWFAGRRWSFRLPRRRWPLPARRTAGAFTPSCDAEC